MTGDTDRSLLDDAASDSAAIEKAAVLLARAAAPAGGDDEALIQLALLAGRARHRTHHRRRRALAFGSSGALAACVVGGLLLLSGRPNGEPESVADSSSPPPAAADQRVAARTDGDGDTTAIVRLTEPPSRAAQPAALMATAHTRFDFEPSEDGHRRVNLRRGAMLFELPPLADNESYEVRTTHLSVHVVGTIFSVETHDGWSAVEVFEGEVEVRDESGTHSVRPGEIFGEAGEGLRSLRGSGRQAAVRRTLENAASDRDNPRMRPPELAVADHLATPRRETQRVARNQVAATTESTPMDQRPVAAQPREGTVAEPNPAMDGRAELDLGEPDRPDLRRGESGRGEPDLGQPDLGQPGRSEPGRAVVRRWITAGRADEALIVARRHPNEPRWRFVEADALRALGRPTEAAARYDSALSGLPLVERREAAYLAARLHLASLNPERSLASLLAGGVAEPGSPLRERGLAIRGDALRRLGRLELLRETAREYLREYPTGGRAAAMGRVLDRVR